MRLRHRGTAVGARSHSRRRSHHRPIQPPLLKGSVLLISLAFLERAQAQALYARRSLLRRQGNSNS